MNEREELRGLLRKAMGRTRDPRTERSEEYLTEEDKTNDKEGVDRTAIKKRPCANCTCGLKEASKERTVRSACGNCYKGDAFRCSGCPSFGLPPYEPGDVVRLSGLDEEFGGEQEL
jgi:anamorsin